jgi:hypothetical protein
MPKGENLRRLTDADIAEIIRHYTTPLPDGTWHSAAAIAREFGVSCPAIHYQLRQHDIAVRSMSETQSGKQYKPRKDHGTPPLCACGCGQAVVSYDRGRKRWRPFLSGHYNHVTKSGPQAPYKPRDPQLKRDPSTLLRGDAWRAAHMPMKTTGES